MTPITSAVRLTPVVQITSRAPQVASTSSPQALTVRPSTVVSLGQQPTSVEPRTYTAKGTLQAVQGQYVWEQNGLDKLSMYMHSAVQSTSPAARFQGLGAALLEQLAANGGQRISQSGLAVNDGTATEPLLLACNRPGCASMPPTV